MCLPQNPLLWSIDTYMTGASSICLIMAAIDEVLHLVSSSTSTSIRIINYNISKTTIYNWNRRIGQCLHLIGILCFTWFWISRPRSVAATLCLEDWYLIPPISAGIPIIWFLHQQNKQKVESNNRKYYGHFVFWCGVMIGLSSLILDKYFCELVGLQYYDLFQATNGVFLGCDLCFLGLYLVLSSTNEKNISQKKLE